MCIPSPILYGVEIKEDAYVPVTTLNLPTPTAVLILVKCNCQKAVQEIVAAIITTLFAPRCVVVRNIKAITPELTETFIQNESDGEENLNRNCSNGVCFHEL